MELVLPKQDRVKENRFKVHNIRNAQKREKYKDTFDEMIRIGEEFKKALGISDDEIYDLLKKRG